MTVFQKQDQTVRSADTFHFLKRFDRVWKGACGQRGDHRVKASVCIFEMLCIHYGKIYVQSMFDCIRTGNLQHAGTQINSRDVTASMEQWNVQSSSTCHIQY